MRADIIIGWIILFAPAGLLLGAVVSFLCIPLYYRMRHIPKEKQCISLFSKVGVMLFTALVFVATLCAASIYSIESTKNDYWKSRADWYSWRVPLAEPYELVMIGTMEQAVIRSWQKGEIYVNDIIRCEKRGMLVAGETGISRSKNDKTVHGWFLFNCATGACARFPSYDMFVKACDAAGFSKPLQLQSVRDVWYTYWKTLE